MIFLILSGLLSLFITLRTTKVSLWSFFPTFFLFWFIWIAPFISHIFLTEPATFFTVALEKTLWFLFVLNGLWTVCLVLRDFVWIFSLFFKKLFKKNPSFSCFKKSIFLTASNIVFLALSCFLTIFIFHDGEQRQEVYTTRLFSEKISQPFKIVVLPELQLHPTFSLNQLQKMIRKVNMMEPDIIVLPGDVLNSLPTKIIDHLHLLGTLTPKQGVFAILGDRDFYHGESTSQTALVAQNISYLKNEIHSFRHPAIELVGVPDTQGMFFFKRQRIFPQKAVSEASFDSFLILLAHTPFPQSTFLSKKPDLQISQTALKKSFNGLTDFVNKSIFILSKPYFFPAFFDFVRWETQIPIFSSRKISQIILLPQKK